MTLMEMHAAQERVKAALLEKDETREALEPARSAAATIDLRAWQQDNHTATFVDGLREEIERLDTQAKNLAMLDTDCSLAVRALLIESATLTKVITYARRNTADTKY